MKKDIIHFSHANGFPAKSYQAMFDSLGEHYEIGYIETLAHNPSYPVSQNWPHLVDELIEYLQTTYDQPVIAVGHSFGAVLNYMAAQRRPDLIKQVILLDAPILERVGSVVVRLAKALGFIDKITPAGRTEGRQETWPNQAQAIEYFKGKSLFRNVDERCLNDYVQYGTEPIIGADADKGIRLRFKADTEVKIYRTIPHNLHRSYANLKVPGAMIYGRQSNVVRPFQVRYMRKSMGLYTHWLTGSHLFPLECPEVTAEAIHQTIKKLTTWKAPVA